MTAGGFYHCSVKNVGRTNGRSVVAAAAYRSGERLTDERTGETADYRARGGVVDTFILSRDGAPAWAHDRARLWNEAERAEPRANGRLATEFELALPHELTAAQCKQLLKDYLGPIIEKHGIAADVAIHAPGEGKDHRNIHAHVLLTHRELGADGFGNIANTRTMARKRKGREVQEQVAGIAATPADIKTIRKDWEQAVNREYERAGLDIQVDHRSHKERGIEQEPTKHLGPAANGMEQHAPGSSDRAAVNREITQRNAAHILAAMREAEASQITADIIDLKADLAMQEAHAGARGKYDSLRETERDVAREQFRGRYDELRAAEPPPEIVREFESNANRTAEPAAPIYDRDLDNALWEDKIAAAGIAAAAERAMQEARDAAKGRTDDTRPAEARQQREPDIGIEARAGEPEPSTSPSITASVAAEPATGMRRADRAASGFFGGLASVVETMLGILSFFGGGEPKLTPQQMHDRARAESNEETLHARGYAADMQQKEAESDERIFNQDRQQQQEDFAARYGVPGGSSGRSRERDDDYDRGRERER
ncbi:MAG: MobQ family relaxase [Rhodopila sp.]